MSDLRSRALAIVRSLAAGEVVSYGEVAALAGRPGAARAVGAVLASSSEEEEGVPWWRVVTASGRLVPGLEAEHARRLRAEGVVIDAGTGRVRLAVRPAGRGRRRATSTS